jgi:hypothetical protein
MVVTEVKSTIHEMIDKIDDSEYLIDLYNRLSSFLNLKENNIKEITLIKNDTI